ncbi:MAG: terminase [Planctomycetaceae bacterium]|nr:terminase [Planctomycetaceae bacterium]
MLQSPHDFRELLLLDGNPLRRLREIVQPWQRTDLAALDPAWMRLSGRTAAATQHRRFVRRAYIERPRGHSKTTDISVQILWILVAARHRLSGLAAAADRDQARLIEKAMRRLADANPELCGDIKFLESLVRNRQTGSELEIISSDIRSSYGALPDFVICDELCHWKEQELWHSLASSAAKKPDCILTVLTNAGVGRGWQWRLREFARASADWHFSSLQGPHAPWITDDSLAEQRALLPEPVFERLWLNIWQHSDGEFVTLAEAEACRDDRLAYQHAGRHGVDYVAAIDYAEKRDNTVGCVCHREGTRVIVDRMDIVRPTPTQPTRVAWVQDWIEDVGASFPQVRFVVDAHQLVHLIQQLEGRYRIQRFEFHGGLGNHRLATTLHQLITQRLIAWYPGCGQGDAASPAPRETRLAERDDLETELAALILKQSSNGRIRFDHRQDGVHHDDRAFTLGVAALTLCEAPLETDHFEIRLPSPDGTFAW